MRLRVCLSMQKKSAGTEFRLVQRFFFPFFFLPFSHLDFLLFFKLLDDVGKGKA